MRLQIPKKYIKSLDSDICVIAAPSGIPELDGYVLRIPRYLVNGQGPCIMLHHGNERTEDGKTYCYMLEKEIEDAGSPSRRYRYTAPELHALYERAESRCREVLPEALTGPGRLIKAAFIAPIPGTRLKHEETAWFAKQDVDDKIAYELTSTPLRGRPAEGLKILEEYRIDDIAALMAVRDRLPNPHEQDILAAEKDQLQKLIGIDLQDNNKADSHETET